MKDDYKSANITKGYVSEYELDRMFEGTHFPHVVHTKRSTSDMRHPDTGEELFEQKRYYADDKLQYIEYADKNGNSYYYGNSSDMDPIYLPSGDVIRGKSVPQQQMEDRELYRERQKAERERQAAEKNNDGENKAEAQGMDATGVPKKSENESQSQSGQENSQNQDHDNDGIKR